MYELVGQLLAAITGMITGNLKITPKTKYLAGILSGTAFFIAYYLLDFFVTKKPKTYGLLLFSMGIGVVFFFIFFIAEYFEKRALRKNNNRK